MLFTDAKNISINGKNVKSITAKGGEMTLFINAHMQQGDLTLLSDKNIIQTNETANLEAYLKSGESGVRVDFYEVLTPTMTLSADKTIIQTDETVNVSAKVKDSDGSIAKNMRVDFYYDDGE